VGLVAIGILMLWLLSTQRTQQDGRRTDGVETKATQAALSSSGKPEKPAAMANPATYAAVRLKEVKANPAKWAEAWTWRQEFAAADTPELQREVLGLARGVGSESLISVLALALASDDPLVRLDAARSIALLSEERMRDGFAIGVGAPDPEIRQEVMDLILQVQPHLRAELLRVALAAAATDVQTRAIDILTDFPSPEFFTVLIEGLRTASSDVRPLVDQAIVDIVNQQFGNFDEATAWWATNRENYDGLMSRIQ
jgi:HEAT repeat protein